MACVRIIANLRYHKLLLWREWPSRAQVFWSFSDLIDVTVDISPNNIRDRQLNERIERIATKQKFHQCWISLRNQRSDNTLGGLRRLKLCRFRLRRHRWNSDYSSTCGMVRRKLMKSAPSGNAILFSLSDTYQRLRNKNIRCRKSVFAQRGKYFPYTNLDRDVVFIEVHF